MFRSVPAKMALLLVAASAAAAASVAAASVAGPVPMGPQLPAPGLETVWNTLEPMVREAKAAMCTELEVRFGLTGGGGGTSSFPDGVTEQAFRHVFARLESSAQRGQVLQLSPEWETTRDMHFASGVRVTRRSGHPDVAIRKCLLGRIDMVGLAGGGLKSAYASGSGGADAGSDGECRMRFSWKSETPVTIPPSELGPLEGVREKRRMSFAYKMWRYDLSVVRGAPVSDFDAISATLERVLPIYEVELEMVAPESATLPRSPSSPQEALSFHSLPSQYLAYSMLLKAQDLCAILLGIAYRPRVHLLAPFTPATSGQS